MQCQKTRVSESFLGLANNCGRLTRDLATIAEPLRKLTRQNEPFVETNEQEHF